MDTDVGAPILDADTAVNVNNDAVKAREIDLKALSPKSRRGYCSVIAEFIRYLAAKKPDLLSQAFLVHIAATVHHPMASKAWKREVVNFLVQAVPPCPIVLTAFDSQIAKVGALPVSSSRARTRTGRNTLAVAKSAAAKRPLCPCSKPRAQVLASWCSRCLLLGEG